jgi:hypothetical protein
VVRIGNPSPASSSGVSAASWDTEVISASRRAWYTRSTTRSGSWATKFSIQSGSFHDPTRRSTSDTRALCTLRSSSRTCFHIPRVFEPCASRNRSMIASRADASVTTAVGSAAPGDWRSRVITASMAAVTPATSVAENVESSAMSSTDAPRA